MTFFFLQDPRNRWSHSLKLYRHHDQVVRNVQEKILARDLGMDMQYVISHAERLEEHVVAIINGWRIYARRNRTRSATSGIPDVVGRKRDCKNIRLDSHQVFHRFVIDL